MNYCKTIYKKYDPNVYYISKNIGMFSENIGIFLENIDVFFTPINGKRSRIQIAINYYDNNLLIDMYFDGFEMRFSAPVKYLTFSEGQNCVETYINSFLFHLDKKYK